MINARNKLLYAFLGFVLCLCIGISLTSATAKIQRIKTEAEIKEKIKRYELKQDYKNTVITKDTVKSNEKRIARLERYVFEKGE